MLRQVARTLLSPILLASLAACGWSVWQISQNPVLRPVADRSADQIVAATDRWLATHATPETIETRLSALLAGEQRNWLAIEAVEAVAQDQGTPLSLACQAQRIAAHDRDSGWLAQGGACVACAVNAANCELSGILICQAPMVLTPLGDVAGIGIECELSLKVGDGGIRPSPTFGHSAPGRAIAIACSTDKYIQAAKIQSDRTAIWLVGG